MKNWRIIILLMILFCPIISFAAQPKLNLPAGVSLKNISLNDKSSDYTIDINYPAVKWSRYPEIEKELNHQIKSQIDKDKAKFLKNREKPFNGLNNAISTDYKVVGLSEKYLSIKFNSLVYFAGYAHPEHWVDTLNFNLKNGKQIALENLFSPGDKYLETISKYCIRELMQQKELRLDKDWVSKGAGPELKNFQYFNLTDKELIITFPEYQIAPYAMGEQEVGLPLRLIKAKLTD